MAGFDNEVMYAVGERLQPSSAQAIGIMQGVPGSTNVSIINYTGNPQNNVSANPSSLSHDPVSGNLYLKVSGTGTVEWKQIVPASGTVITLQGTTGGKVSPDVTGNIFILGGVNTAGVLPVSTAGTTNTITVNVQRSQAISVTDSTKVGLSVFNSAQFTVNGDGFVSTSGTGVLNTLTGNTGGAISPLSGNINTLGTGSITIAGSPNTLTTQLTGLTNHAVLVGAGTATITNVGPTATAGQVLQSAGSAADPAFSTATYPSTTTVSQILYSSSTNVVSGLATANRAVLTTGATGVPVLTALATDGQLIIGSTAGVPAAANITSSDSSVTITNGSNSISLTVTGGTTVGKTITGNTGGPLNPTGGNWNIFGASTLAGTSPVTTSGTGSTLTVNVQKSQAIAAPDATKIGLSAFKSSQFSVDSTGFVSLSNPINFISGTWTPTLFGATTAGTTNYDPETEGTYVQFGNLAFVRALITINSATGTGDATIGGLPFTVYNNSAAFTNSQLGLAGTWVWPAGSTAPIFHATTGTKTGTMSMNGSARYTQSMQMQNVTGGQQMSFSIAIVYQISA